MVKRFATYYKPHLRLFILDLLAALFISGVDLVFPLFTKTFINEYIPNGQISLMLQVTALVIFLYTLRMGAQFFMSYWGHIMGSRMEYDMRGKLFRHIQTLPFKFFDDNKTGQIMSRLIGDLREIAELAHHGPEDLFISIIMISGSFIILMMINVPLTLIVFFFVLLLLLFTYTRRNIMMNASRNVRRKHASINAKVENSISGIRLAKSFSNEDYEIDKFEEYNQQHLDSRNQFYHAMAIFATGTNFLADIIGLVVIVVGGIFVYQGNLDMGELIAYLLYSTYFIKPIRRLIQFTQQFQSGMAGFERYLELLDTSPEIADAKDAITLEEVKGEILLNKITFRYDEKDGHVLRDFTLEIPAGKKIALVGPSGVGKTTISQLIPRFYDVEKGQVLIDGHNVKDVTMRSLRQFMGIVSQDVFIFYGSIRENILYGKPEATDEEIYEAAKNANIHDFIMKLPQGYDTIVGERGIKLSGGQKQRLAIARVFLKNPPILILDEATSALDNENELAIQESLERLSKDRTTLTIAHRLTTVITADEILVLTEEGIAERGNHETLIGQKGLYAGLFKAQFKGYIPDEVL